MLTVEIADTSSVGIAQGAVRVICPSGEELSTYSLKLNYDVNSIVTATIEVPVIIKYKE